MSKCAWASLTVVGIVVASSMGQLPDLTLPIPLPLPELPIPSLGDLQQRQPPITTSIDDALWECPWLDPIGTETCADGMGLPLSATGVFTIQVGHWLLDLQSFCIKPGAERPGEGDAYLYAPLKGPQADMLSRMLVAGWQDPSVTQEALQEVIWAVIIGTAWEELPPEGQAVAHRLMTPRELAELKHERVGYIPEEQEERVFGVLPPQVSQVLRGENLLRRLFATGQHDYGTLEAAAVPPTSETPQTNRPWGRWSYHPEGFYIRFEPDGYARCRTFIIRPQPVTINRDNLGRVVELRAADGRRALVRYGPEPGRTVPDTPELQVYRFAEVRCLAPDGSVNCLAEELGWTYVQSPARGHAAQPAAGVRFVQDGGADDAFFGQLEDFYERLSGYKDLKGKVDDLNGRIEKQFGRKPTPEELCNFYNVEHFKAGFDAAVKGGETDRVEWLVDNLKLGVDAYIEAGNVIFDPELFAESKLPSQYSQYVPHYEFDTTRTAPTPIPSLWQRLLLWLRGGQP